MSIDNDDLKQWVATLAALINDAKESELEHHTYFPFEPDMALQLVAMMKAIDEKTLENERAYYSACIFAFDICVAQLQALVETGHKLGVKVLDHLMNQLASAINERHHSLSFWLPVLNAFYEVHVELSPSLKDAYLVLASDDDEFDDETEESHLNAIREMIAEMSDLSHFDIAENFFAQSYAMPADFFMDLMLDLYSIEEGHDIALLMLMHPKEEVREVVVETLSQLMDKVTLTPLSLSRLQMIKPWYHKDYHSQFDAWIKLQRKKGGVFSSQQPIPITEIRASEVDGSGAQGLFILIKENRRSRFCGLLLQSVMGIKDAWVTSTIPAREVKQYFSGAFENVTMRIVDEDYTVMMVNHFLALTLARGDMPGLHLLEMQELLGMHWTPEKINIATMMDELSVQIQPFTPEIIQESFKRSNAWTTTRRFTESWYFEETEIDKIVNQYSSIQNGVKVCLAQKAHQAVLTEVFERYRHRFIFHFLWVSLWLKCHPRKGEKSWQDSFMIAYAIYSGTPLTDIPILHVIAEQTVANSIETMNERRTHLH